MEQEVEQQQQQQQQALVEAPPERPVHIHPRRADPSPAPAHLVHAAFQMRRVEVSASSHDPVSCELTPRAHLCDTVFHVLQLESMEAVPCD